MTSGECSKRFGSLSLAAVTMDQNRFDCVTTQCRCHPSCAPTRATEDHYALAISIFNEGNRQCGLRLIVNVVDVLTQVRARLWSSGHLGAVATNQIDPLGIAQHFFNHLLNRPRHGCCVEEQLSRFRRTRKNFLRLRKKAHVQHSISFIKHTLLHERQRNGIKLAQFLDATGRSDQQVNAD
jgi:hypothetical protein